MSPGKRRDEIYSQKYFLKSYKVTAGCSIIWAYLRNSVTSKHFLIYKYVGIIFSVLNLFTKIYYFLLFYYQFC